MACRPGLRCHGVAIKLSQNARLESDDLEWDRKVVERILHNLSLLLGRDFGSVQQLNRYRKDLGVRSEAPALAC